MSLTENFAPIFRAAMEVLRDANGPMQPNSVCEAVASQVEIAPEYQLPDAQGQALWWSQLGFRTGEAAALGWMVKRNGWSIVEAGIAALEEFPGNELFRELTRQYEARRLPTQERSYADPRWKTVLEALTFVEPGNWTTYGELAELVGMSPQSVGGFMASASGGGSAHRVLQASGRISPGFRWPDPERTDQPREVLEQEGLRFDPSGRADSAKRITVLDFRLLMSTETVEKEPVAVAPPAFHQFQQNLNYARQLVHGGRNLELLQVGAFDVTDLYRAAWTQAVAALDHWVTREIVDRGVALAQQPKVARPPKFNNLSMPVELFEKVHHHEAPLGETFRAHLEQVFGFMTFQNPEKIKEGFAYVSAVNLWPAVAKVLTDQDPTTPISADGVRTQLREIAWRRNNIAHTADHDPELSDHKKHITAEEAERTIAQLESIAIAILLALGDPLPVAEDVRPAEAGPFGSGDGVGQTWDEESLLAAVHTHCPPDVATTLLALYRHAESHPAFRGYSFGEADHPSVAASFSLGYDEAAVWSIHIGEHKTVLSLNFEWMRNRGPSTQRLAQFADALLPLPGWASARQAVFAADFSKRATLGPLVLARSSTAGVIIAALNDLLSGDAK
ncbi:MGMT family protein [Herbidospora sp. RD11066]